jgi:hypothetical protein
LAAQCGDIGALPLIGQVLLAEGIPESEFGANELVIRI